MDEIQLSEKEQRFYDLIKKLAEEGGNKKRTALTLGCSVRSVKRHIAGYRAKGKAYFAHGNRGQRPINAYPEELAKLVVELYLTKYEDATFAHFTELLSLREGLHVSLSTVRRVLTAANIISPRATRVTRKLYRAQLKAMKAKAKGKKDAVKLPSVIVDRITHPRRPRCANFGEMIQMDASLHPWYGDCKATLHLAVDDATGVIVGAWFDEQETLHGYYHVFYQILTTYGIPYMFYTDRRTVFEYRKSGSTDAANDYSTPFGYACKQLGIQIKSTSVPQAKGRIERFLHSVQLRLPVELRLEGVTTIEQGNNYLPRFIAAYNAKFALDAHSIPSVFETQPSLETINLTLAVISERTIDPGHAVRFENAYYQTVNRNGMFIRLVSGTKGLVIRAFSGDLFFATDSHVFALEEIPLHDRTSRNFDPPVALEPPKARYVPPLSHPWKRASFLAFQKLQASKSSQS